MTDSWSAHVRPFHLFHDNLYRISFLSNFLSSCFRHHSKIITRLGFTLITWSRRAATWAERSVYTCHPDAPRNDSPSSSLPLALRKSRRKCTGCKAVRLLFYLVILTHIYCNQKYSDSIPSYSFCTGMALCSGRDFLGVLRNIRFCYNFWLSGVTGCWVIRYCNVTVIDSVHLEICGSNAFDFTWCCIPMIPFCGLGLLFLS